MATELIEERFSGVFNAVSVNWAGPLAATFECRVLVCPEEEGGYSAHALRLPGVVSQGATVDEAVDRIKDAFQATLQAYRESGEVPWSDNPVERTKDCVERWVLVNV